MVQLSSRLLYVILLFSGVITITKEAAWAQTIPNPSFEGNSYAVFPGYAADNGGAIAGWTIGALAGLNPAVGSPFADNGATPHGVNVAFLQGPTTSLATTISGLTVGTTYRVSFWANQRSGAAPLGVCALNGGAAEPFISSPAVGGTNAYHRVQRTFIATAATAPLVITNQQVGDTTVLVDDFRIAAQTLLTVLNANDSGPGSLRQVIQDAPTDSIVTFAPGLSGATITLTSGEITFLATQTALMIDASALPAGITISGNNPRNVI